MINSEKEIVALVYGNQDPNEKGLVRQRPSLGEFFVKFWISHGNFGRDIFIQDEGEDWQHCVDRSVADHKKALVKRDGSEIENRREYSLHRRYDESAVDDELG